MCCESGNKFSAAYFGKCNRMIKWLYGGVWSWEKGPEKAQTWALSVPLKKKGREVLCVSKQCAKEQTEANDGHAEHRDLGGQPVLSPQQPHRPNTARHANGLGEDPNSGAFEMPSGKNSTSLFCILSNQHVDQRFSQLLLVLYFFFSPSLLWKQKSFDSELPL